MTVVNASVLVPQDTGGQASTGARGEASGFSDVQDPVPVFPRQLPQSPVERCNAAPVMQRDGEQMRVRHLPVPHDALEETEGIVRQGHAVFPELMLARRMKLRQEGDRLPWRAGVGNGPGVGGNPDEARLGGRAGGPAGRSGAYEPVHSRTVVNVVGPRQRNEDVDVQQGSQRSSSADSTISGVIGGAFSRTAKTGISCS